MQAASAEVGNSWASVASGKEYVSLFQVTRQNGKLVAFIINNIPDADNYYYLIIFSEGYKDNRQTQTITRKVVADSTI